MTLGTMNGGRKVLRTVRLTREFEDKRFVWRRIFTSDGFVFSQETQWVGDRLHKTTPLRMLGKFQVSQLDRIIKDNYLGRGWEETQFDQEGGQADVE